MEEHTYAPNPSLVALDFDESITDLVEHLLVTKVPRGETPKGEHIERAVKMMMGISGLLPNGFTLNVDPQDHIAVTAVDLLKNGNEMWEPDWHINGQRKWPKVFTTEEEEIYRQRVEIYVRCHTTLSEAFGRILYGWREEKIRALGEGIRKYWRLAFAQKFATPQPPPPPPTAPLETPSDRLSAVVSTIHDLLGIIHRKGHPAEAVGRLVQQLRTPDGYDNISAFWDYLPDDGRRSLRALHHKLCGNRGWDIVRHEPEEVAILLRAALAGLMLPDASSVTPPPSSARLLESPITKTKRDGKPSADRQNDILAAIRVAKTPLTRPEIVQVMKLKTEGKLGANLAWMVDAGLLQNIPQRGYWPAGETPPV
jgi:hypothetical protein